MLDILIAAALLAGAIHGFTTGAIKQVASLFGIIVSFAVAFRLMQSVGAATSGYLGVSEEMAPLVGFIIVFALVQGSIIVAAKLIEKIVGALQLGTVNRVLGSGLGAAKAALVLSIAFIALAAVGFPEEASKTESKLYAPVAGFLPTVWSAFSDRTGFDSFSDVFRGRTAQGSAE